MTVFYWNLSRGEAIFFPRSLEALNKLKQHQGRQGNVKSHSRYIKKKHVDFLCLGKSACAPKKNSWGCGWGFMKLAFFFVDAFVIWGNEFDGFVGREDDLGKWYLKSANKRFLLSDVNYFWTEMRDD